MNIVIPKKCRRHVAGHCRRCCKVKGCLSCLAFKIWKDEHRG